MAVVIGTKGIDLSVGSIIAICGAVITWRIHAGDPHLLILFCALGVGLLCGMWNGFLVAVLDIQPIIATLILMVSGRGIGLMINLLYGGTNPSYTSALLQGLSTGHIAFIPTRLLVFLLVFVVLWVLLRRTALGMFLESVGGNAKAAYLTGINARLIIFSAYIICGLTAAAAGVILSADTHTSDPVSIGLLHRARRDPGGGDRRRLAGRRPHLSRHDDPRRPGHPGLDDVDPHQRPAARIQSGGQGGRGHGGAAAPVGQLPQSGAVDFARRKR